MDGKEARKIMSSAIRGRKFDDRSDDLTIKAITNAFKLRWKGKEAGQLQFTTVTWRMSAPGAMFGVYLECVTDGGAISDKLKGMKLSFKPQFDADYHFSVTSLMREEEFGVEGKFSVFANEPIEKQTEDMADQAERHYLPSLIDFVTGHADVIGHVLNDPSLYAYPTATIAIALALAGEDVDEARLTSITGGRKLYDATPKRMAEIITKLNRMP